MSEEGRETVSGLVQHILDTHHKYLRSALPELSRLCLEAMQGNGEKLQPLKRTLEGLCEELESHMWKEEMVLFPLALELEEARRKGQPAPPSHCGSVRNPIRVMELEHQEAIQALSELRRVSDGYAAPAGAGEPLLALYRGLAELEVDLRKHIDIEDRGLFPRIAELEGSPA